MLQSFGVSVEVYRLTVIKHVIFLVQVVASLLRQLFLEGEHEVVLCEAALALGDGAAHVETLLRLVQRLHPRVSLRHFLLVQVCVGHAQVVAQAPIWPLLLARETVHFVINYN